VQRRPRHELEGRDRVVFDSGAVIGGGRSHSEKHGRGQNVGSFWQRDLEWPDLCRRERGEDAGSRGQTRKAGASELGEEYYHTARLSIL
jgi:hypothetical protein